MTIIPGTSVKKTGIILNTPELRYSTSGLAICTFDFRVIVGEDHKVVCFGDMAEDLLNKDIHNIREGSSVTIWGYFKIREWMDRDRKKRQRPELIIRKIEVY